MTQLSAGFVMLPDKRPNLIKRRCGGWLAVSNKSMSLRIGVTAATEREALLKFRDSLAAWEKNLAKAKGDIPTLQP